MRNALVVVLALSLSGVASAAPKPVAKAPAGVIKGTVIFEGEAPDRPKLVRDTDPVCAKTDKLAEDVIVTKGKLKDVLVRIKNGTAGRHAAPAQPAVIDQRECMYTPRVLGVVAGQQLTMRNSDGTFHNVHGTVNGKLLWNKPHAKGDADIAVDSTPQAGDVIDIVCDVHPWMHAYAVVQDHPFFAITREDGGFEIKGLAPGTYTLEAWHPTLGTKTLTVKIGVGPKASVTARFSYKKT